MADLWMPGAIKKPGPPDKVGYEALGFGVKGPKKGDVKHSAEGSADGLLTVLHGPRRASWHFSVLYGAVWQHYPVNAHCWHAGDTDDDGGVRANIELVGIEHEGMAGFSLTDYQVEMTVEITKFCAEFFDRTEAYARYPIMPVDGWTLAEHNQISDSFTACPSNRVDWEALMALLVTQEVEDMATAFWKATGPTVYFVNGNTKRAMHGERVELAKALNISDQVVEVSDDLLASLKEAV